MIYLDTAALMKLVRREPHTEELVAWLNDPQRNGSPRVASTLAEVELPRAVRRNAPAAAAGVPGVLAALYLLEIDATVRQTAAAYSDPLLRSLDAIHLATAQMLARQPGADLTAFVTYDKRLAEAARGAGLPVWPE
ncbi:type II toxin-antitoxin system VapC family toxin [Allokutzneria sp. A3M-2-11 16]|uniref:type II toxin-antitoxin system VapC family toxin n=1 Tax=Allokutzneria sp. A3M-2-11 16 TaxID=2962043 RepID=UPI0020B796F0|nr:type II toxin-antitoxin system VapC family toxin [Allokutzneria sp. A3M-2-11 16]MCP3802505.1 type II toxin-antitoxin system VapC family toxin [Allokutzneria sp. A3M-2-11 16]